MDERNYSNSTYNVNIKELGEHIWNIKNFRFVFQLSSPEITLYHRNAIITCQIQNFRINTARDAYYFNLKVIYSVNAHLTAGTSYTENLDACKYCVTVGFMDRRGRVHEPTKVIESVLFNMRPNDPGYTFFENIRFVSKEELIQELHSQSDLAIQVKIYHQKDVVSPVPRKTLKMSSTAQIPTAGGAPEAERESEAKMDVSEMSYGAIKECLLRLIITRNVNDVPKIVSDLLIVADKYDCDELKKVCEEILIDNFNVENICDILILADTYKTNTLKAAAVEYFVANANNVFNLAKYQTDRRLIPAVALLRTLIDKIS